MNENASSFNSVSVRISHMSHFKETQSFLIVHKFYSHSGHKKKFQLGLKLDTWNPHISLSSLGKNNKLIT